MKSSPAKYRPILKRSAARAVARSPTMYEHTADPIKLLLPSDVAAKAGSIRFAVDSDDPNVFHGALIDLITRAGAKYICDIGGGANPELTVTEVEDLRLRYTVLDVSPVELDKSDDRYNKFVADIAGPVPPKENAFDLVFSRMLAEHVADAEAFHRNVFHMLKPNGFAFHFFPTLYALPFTLNWLLPERLSTSLLLVVNPTRDLNGYQAKFPAWYRRCEGPTPRQVRWLENIGFEVVDFVGIFGHNGYYSRLPFMLNIHQKISAFLCRHRVAWQTSFAYVLLRKPAE